MKFPPVTIVMTTYFPRSVVMWSARVVAASKAAKSWREHLCYEGQVHLHIADDGSDLKDIEKLMTSLDWDRGLVRTTRQERRGVGASLNIGFLQSYDLSPFILYFVDDWALIESFNLTPWVKLLLERNPEVGMVRLGPPHPFLTGRVEPLSTDWDGWALRLDRVGYAFGHRPALYHRCFTDAYGPFQENVSALECEKHYAEEYAIGDGPEVVLALHHPWQHIYSIEMSSIDPTERNS